MAKILGGSRAVRGVRIAFWLLLAVTGVTRSMGDDAAVERRVEWLRAEIARHDELYFKKTAPEISDEAYDRLKRELTDLEKRTSAVVGKDERHAGEGSGGVGDDRSGRFPTWRHGRRMLSLEKIYTETELRTFLKRAEASIGDVVTLGGVSWVIEPKYDGLAISATYERGQLVRVVTRGDGSEGDAVTANARMIGTLPEALRGTAWPERIEVRGEVFANFAEFERVNAEREAAGEALFANPRALAAGSLKLSEPAEVQGRGLSVVFYGWGEVWPESARPETQSGFHEQLKTWGLPGIGGVGRAKTVEEVCAQVRIFAGERSGRAFPTDGVVLKLDEVAQQERLGETGNAPRWAVAYKFATERAVTRVTGITIQVGRSGVLTPVAELAPVRLGGSTVARATLHNAEEIARLDVRGNDVVFVEKAGEVIPAVVGVDRTQRTAESVAFVFPEDCPACGSAVVTRTEAGVKQYCRNGDCGAQVAARLRHFAGASGVAIRGLGDTTIAALVATGRVRTPADLFQLTREDWRALPGIGEKTAEKLEASVETGKRAELWRFVHGLGVPGVGVATSRILGRTFSSLEELAGATPDELAGIDGVGPAQAEEVVAFFETPEMRQQLAELRACGVKPRPFVEDARRGPLAGKVLVLTGTLPALTRAEAEERIVAAGGVIGGRVTARTDCVVAGVGAGEKRRKAEELGVRIIDETELLRMLGGGVTGQ
jgi:DNA ligase (NAD+)